MTRVAYLVNQYPKVSHSFIRREMVALERQGVSVLRVALRGWNADVVDPEDMRERAQTRYLLKRGTWPLLKAVVASAVGSPVRFARAAADAFRMGLSADRPLPFHAAYLAEACLLLEWIEEERIGHIHAHFGTNSAEVAMLAHRLGGPRGPSYSFTVHGPEEFDKPTALHLAEKIRHAAFVVAISSYGRSQLYRWADRRDWGRIHVVHCGLEHAFHDIPPRPLPAEPRLVCVGRLDEQKGQFVLVRAASLLLRRGRAFSIVLVGDGALRGELERAIAAAGLTDRVRITGWVAADRVREELLSARALVLPSFAEGLPVVCMEALALRRPVLSTYIAGIPELVRDGIEGFLFPAGDAEALADALERFLDLPAAAVEAMGERGRTRALERHSADTEAAKLKLLFEAVARRDVVTSAAAAEARA